MIEHQEKTIRSTHERTEGSPSKTIHIHEKIVTLICLSDLWNRDEGTDLY